MLKAKTLTNAILNTRETAVTGLCLMLALLALAGCETGYRAYGDRYSMVAPPPPAFDPVAQNLMTGYDVSYASEIQVADADVSTIEPAAGAAMAVSSMMPALAAAPSDCGLRVGGADDAFFYQWDGSRLGLGMGSKQRDHDFGAVAAVRYSISLDGGAKSARSKSSSCLGNELSFN